MSDYSSMTSDEQPQTLKILTQVWAIYYNDRPDGPHYAELARPQDWGDPRWMYRVYVLEAAGYRNESHCWLDRQVSENDHLELFSSLLHQMLIPGSNPKLCGRDYLREDDFWLDDWGKMPPFLEDEYDNGWQEERLDYLRPNEDDAQ